MRPTHTQRSSRTWLVTTLVAALVAALLGIAASTPARAATAADSPGVRPDCITSTTPPVRVLNTLATRQPLRAKSPVRLQLPEGLRSAHAVIVHAQAASRSATSVHSGVDPSQELPLVALGTGAPHHTQSTGVMEVTDGGLTLESSTTANLVLTVIGTVDTSSTCAHLMHDVALDTRRAIGTDAGPVGVGDTRRIALVADGALPDALHSALVSFTLSGGSTPSNVELVIDGITIKSYEVPAGQVVNAFEVVPPTASGGIRLGVTAGSVDMQATPLAWMDDASALNGEKIRISESTSSTDANPGGLRLLLPDRARDALAVFVTLNASSRPDRVASMRIRPGDTTFVGQPIFSAAGVGQQLRGMAVVRPGPDGSVVLTVHGAVSYTASIVGWSSRVVPNAPADNVTVAVPTDVSVVSADPTTSDPSVITYAGGDKLQPGDVVAATPSETDNDGLLVKVTSVAHDTPVSATAGLRSLSVAAAIDAGEQIANVEPASLDDLLPSAEFDQSGAVDSGDYQQLDPLPDLPPDSPPSPPNPDGSPALTGSALRAATAGSSGASGSPTFSCTGGIGASLGAGLKLYGDTHLSASWGGWFGSPSADFGFTGGVSGDVHASVSGKASCSGSQTFRGPNLPSFRTMVGPVPLWITPELTLTVSAHGSFESSLTASAGFNAQVNAGIRYANGSYSPYRNASLTFPASVQARAGASFHVDVVPRITFRVESLVGPYVELDAWAQANVNLGQNPWWTVDAGVNAAVGIDLDLKIKHLSYQAGSVTLWSGRVAQASGGYNGPSGGGGTPGGGTAGSYYDRALTASGGRAPYSWYRVAGVLPPGITLRTDGHLVGTPQAAGSWTIVVRVIDANGNRVASDQTVTMSFGNPAPVDSRWVSAAEVGNAQGRPGCTSSYCKYLQVSFGGFGGGAHSVVCNADNAPAWYSYSTSATTTAYCYYGYPGHTVWATVDGVRSNQIRW